MAGTGQEVSIMRSTLIQTGVIVDIETNPTIDLHPADENIAHMLEIIQGFLAGANANGGQSFSALYDVLTSHQHGIGLKHGVIPIYLAVVLHLCKQNLVIKGGDLEAKITPDLLNDINENPGNYSVIVEDWNEEKAEYMAGLEKIFSRHIVEKEKAYNSFAYIVLAMNRWYASLPKYAKNMSGIYCGGNGDNAFRPLTQNKKRFMNSLKQLDGNPREYLFEKLFYLFGMNEFNLDILDIISTTKQEFDAAIPSLLTVLTQDVKAIFADNGARNCTLSSAIRDWYESLDEATIQHLFPRNENKILELMKSVTNDEASFMQRLCKAITSLRVDDWIADTIAVFLRDLRAYKETVEDYNHKRESGASSASDVYRIVFTNSSGKEVVKTFNKTEYSSRAKVLFNDITTSLDEMGQSITEQEKRQVLIELLEKLC
jgi:hypothetical protein